LGSLIIIINRQLHFTFADNLSDEYEGRFGALNNILENKELPKFCRETFGISSWHRSDYESHLMWRAYSCNNNTHEYPDAKLKDIKILYGENYRGFRNINESDIVYGSDRLFGGINYVYKLKAN